jgi:hypothetical protein
MTWEIYRAIHEGIAVPSECKSERCQCGELIDLRCFAHGEERYVGGKCVCGLIVGKILPNSKGDLTALLTSAGIECGARVSLINVDERCGVVWIKVEPRERYSHVLAWLSENAPLWLRCKVVVQ